jgi:hypothetical protein
MTKFTRFSAPVAILAAIAIPVFAQGCSAADELCCSDPTKIEIQGQAGAQFSVAVGAAADLAAVAQGSLDDVVSACRNIATDLDATTEELATAQAAQGNDAATAWCNLAVAKIKGNVTAQGGLTVTFAAPQCQASVSAKANCQAKCDVSGKCDIKANLPQCTGGKLEVSCKGSCKAEGSASVACEGSCGAECKGSCQATGGVKCEGKCEGTCEAEAGTAGSGIQADGTCKGTCKGTCEVTAPGVKCEGSCKGQCTGECKATANVAVKCDGKCDGDFEPLKCEGGKLEGGCKVDAKCDANCDASVSAKAECTPPELTIKAGANVQAKYIDSLKANLPQLVVVFQARGEAFVKTISTVGGSLAGSVSGDIGVKGIACLNTVGAQVVNATGQMTAAVSASGNVVGSLGK